ncbi:tyrosine-protein phosphatase [Prescottella sp. R16]|uniref:tyrosine-protein phosphatase n=1 Tax=Prescottella sp. R16 TaxID=3064529 RepID=UPI00272E3892|nr:tyrosine-protein phosphatase [Prescottella sp. R16]
MTQSRTALVRAAVLGAALLTPVTVSPLAVAAPVSPADPADPAATVRVEGAKNFRDLGGYATVDGRHVRTGVVFRSNKLSSLTDAGRDALAAAGITLDVDLRNMQERRDDPDLLPDGVRYRVADVVSLEHGIGFREFVPITLGRAVLGAAATGSSGGSDGGSAGSSSDDWSALGQAIGYPFMVTFRGADVAFGDLLTAIAGNTEGATVFHCSAGKDRTGWGAAVLLSVLGVPRETVYADFLASNTYLGRDDAVEKSWLDAAFARVDDLYGGIDAYVRDGLGVDGRTVDALRARLLV